MPRLHDAFGAMLIALAVAWSAAAAPVAKGALTVKGQKLALTQVYAYATEGFFDKKKNDVVVILSDTPISEAAARDHFALQDKGIQYLKLTIDAAGQIISCTPQHKAFKVVMSGGSTDYVFEAKVNDGKTISGRAYTKSPQEGFDDEPWSFDATFEAPVAPKR